VGFDAAIVVSRCVLYENQDPVAHRCLYVLAERLRLRSFEFAMLALLVNIEIVTCRARGYCVVS
jgi:hypothetical protein